MYFSKSDMVTPRRVINIKNTYVQLMEELKTDKYKFNIILTSRISKKDGTKNI